MTVLNLMLGGDWGLGRRVVFGVSLEMAFPLLTRGGCREIRLVFEG